MAGKFSSQVIKKIKTVSDSPGIYIFRDKKRQPLYVGKARNLKQRLKSYILNFPFLGEKTKTMLLKAKRLEIVSVDSEIEALLLEAEVINRLKPKYNIRLKDDKHYEYIKITKPNKDLKKKELGKFYSRVTTSRKKEKNAFYFGPFPKAKTVGLVLKILRKIFPFRDCSSTKFVHHKKQRRGCLYFDLDLCPGPCVEKFTPQYYEENIHQLLMFLRGKKKKLLKDLEKNMQKEASKRNFEKAAVIRDRILALTYIAQPFRKGEDFLAKPTLMEDICDQQLSELRKILSRLLPTDKPLPQFHRIEAYDISNLSGKEATGSMVVFIEGEPDKSQYRRFRIKTKQKPHDVGMISEVIRRRLKHLPEKGEALKKWEKPDLVLVDGGLSQLRTTEKVLKEENVCVPVVALAKKFEQIYFKDNKLNLPLNSPALHLLQHIRDEAHRFALSYHLLLRKKFFTQDMREKS